MTTDSQPTTEAMAERLSTLYEINQAINSSLELDVVLDAVMDKVIEVTQAQRGFLMLSDEQGNLSIEVARGLNKEDLDTPDFQYSTTIVSEVVDSGQALLTSNAEHDSRFKAGQSIIALGLRSILCVPINVKGRLIGVAYVDNSLKAGVFKQNDLALLNSFAAIAGIAIENARLHRFAVENARLERELSMAYEIQRSMLPQVLPTLPGYEVAAHWRSAREVGGDFFDVFVLDDNRLGVVIADVADKGVGAALFMAVARSLIRGNAFTMPTPMETLQQANRLILMEDSESGMFVTTYYTIFNLGGHAIGTNAGHNRPMLFHHHTGDIELLPRGGWAIGWFDDIPLVPNEFNLEPGDTLVYYTDGLTEAENIHGEYFGEDRLADIMRREAEAGHSADTILARINDSVDAFVGEAPPFDDLTLVVVRYTGEN